VKNRRVSTGEVKLLAVVLWIVIFFLAAVTNSAELLLAGLAIAALALFWANWWPKR
jgi:hypothetical protein